jgi:hypothetical protein
LGEKLAWDLGNGCWRKYNKVLSEYCLFNQFLFDLIDTDITDITGSIFGKFRKRIVWLQLFGMYRIEFPFPLLTGNNRIL